ncbi:hypothetical protein BDV93DRAFT_512632 [Ceratobasidium sp. AG-I]|nr:hypothetical protein BDV93DRAFT_512632 [Ceratobasidium sp. AG-I]
MFDRLTPPPHPKVIFAHCLRAKTAPRNVEVLWNLLWDTILQLCLHRGQLPLHQRKAILPSPFPTAGSVTAQLYSDNDDDTDDPDNLDDDEDEDEDDQGEGADGCDDLEDDSDSEDDSVESGPVKRRSKLDYADRAYFGRKPAGGPPLILAEA